MEGKQQMERVGGSEGGILREENELRQSAGNGC